MQGIVLQLKIFPRPGNTGDECPASGRVILNQSIVLSCLDCLGAHPAANHCHRVMFLIHSNYFVFDEAGGDDSSPLPSKHVYIGPFEQHQVLPSYNTSLLTRLLRMHRAMNTQSVTNAQFKRQLRKRGVTDASQIEDDATATVPEPPRSLRQQVFSQRLKQPATRLKELQLRSQIERLRLRNELYHNEKKRMQSELDDTLKEINDIKTKVSDTNVELMNNIHMLSKDKTAFSRWEERLAANVHYVSSLKDVLQSSQLNLIHSFQDLFPIQNADDADGKMTTIRWISVPGVDEAKGKSNSELMLAVSTGWIAEMVVIFSSVLNIPLRFPIKLHGSNSSIVDHLLLPALGSNEFPLYTKGADITRAEYGIYILQKDLAQLRWACGLPTSDFKLSLKNLHELMLLKEKMGVGGARLDLELNALSPPPGSTTGTVAAAARMLSPARKIVTLLPDVPYLSSNPPPLAPSSTSSSPTSSSVASLSSNTATSNGSGGEEGASVPPIKKNSTEDKLPQKSLARQPEVAAAPASAASAAPASSSFWGDVQNRTQALSVTTSFQRHKPVGNHN
jgi:hypothetical protein